MLFSGNVWAELEPLAVEAQGASKQEVLLLMFLFSCFPHEEFRVKNKIMLLNFLEIKCKY